MDFTTPQHWIKLFDSKTEADRLFSLNSVRTLVVNGTRVCLGRLHDGYYAIDDRCPHQNASLGKGECKPSGYVECPFHHYHFDLRSGKNIGNQETDVPTFPVKVTDDGIFIALTPSTI